MKPLRDRIDAALDSYDMHGDSARLAMDAARAALEVVKAKACSYDMDAWHPFSAVDVDDIDALLEELE